MRLIKLSANRETFKTVEFNRTGLTLIVGSKSQEGETYNGVGKSLIIEILHFCLGSNKNSEFENKIPGWEFELEFELSRERHTVSRNTSKQKVVYLNHKELKVSEFNSWMESNIFSVPQNIDSLTYRSLLPKFMRRGQKEYNDPRDTSDFTPYAMLVRNAFLLGIDVHLIARKAQIRQKISDLKNLRKNFKEDPLLKEFYSAGKDPDIHLGHIKRRIEKLERDRDAFIVAENYYDLQNSADDLATEIENDKNSVFLINSALENVEKSLKEQPDLPLENLRKLYGELEQTFKPESLKQLDDLSDFHKRLLKNRVTRLSREKLHMLDQRKELENNLKNKQAKLDKQLKILGESRALDQYTAIVNEIAHLTTQSQKLKDYKAIDLEYSNREANLEGQLSEEVIKANAYLEETKAFRDKNFDVFKELVARFYPTSPAGISLHNNEKNDNKKRFDFDVHIENDNSDGVNEVRVFCYDLTLLILKQGHNVDFVFHDSRLYANMDVRQRAILFHVVNEITNSLGCQYIATLNPDQITSIEAEFEKDEFKAIITDNIVLELKDDSDGGKLLGIQVDMHYDRR